MDEYLEFYGGPGVQRMAVQTQDIVAAVRELKARGVRFLATPTTYYDGRVAERVGEIEPITRARRVGYPHRPGRRGPSARSSPSRSATGLIFAELIERHGSRGFGAGNFKALFEALEREQELRGNL